jgi:hypothetical protein
LIFDRQRQNAGASAGIVDAALRDRQGLIEQGLIAITRGNFPDSLFGFHRPKQRALCHIARQPKTPEQQTLVAAYQVESLLSTASASYSVRNRTSMTPSRSIVAYSK